jgi:sec-independent protein translocase protein TatA
MNLGTPEIILILVVILLLFGAKRIPEMMKAMGQGVKEFKKAAKEVTDDVSTSASTPAPPTTPAAPTKDNGEKPA